MLPDRSVLIGQKISEICHISCDIFSNFQTMWIDLNPRDQHGMTPFHYDYQL